jgi:hypothetical protein
MSNAKLVTLPKRIEAGKIQRGKKKKKKDKVKNKCLGTEKEKRKQAGI